MSEKTTSKATATKDLTGNVQRLLEALSRQKSIEPLKQLFWSELNYERANRPLSYRDWPEQIANVLYEAPLLFATGGIKVFEELVTGRHETGSYYTPKPVVSFMCREALKGYLQTKLPGEALAAVEQFVDEHDPQGLHNPEAVLDALRRVKVCDPACGSGAYLLGMLHKLLDLRTCLFATRQLDSISVYERKLEIIQNNVYGVDIDPFATNIARLRLWLSLVVDFEGAKPLPLPNLDFKIEAGDSLNASITDRAIITSLVQKCLVLRS